MVFGDAFDGMMWMPLIWLQHMCEAHCSFVSELLAASEVTRRRSLMKVVN
jgi:hypothetical protein